MIFLIQAIFTGLAIWRGWKFRIAIIPVAVTYIILFCLAFFVNSGNIPQETFGDMNIIFISMGLIALLVMIIVGRKKQKVQKPIVDQVK